VIPYQGFDGKFKQFEYYWAGILSLIVGLYVFLVEYPRGMRTKGSLVERRFVKDKTASRLQRWPFKYDSTNVVPRAIFNLLLLPAAIMIHGLRQHYSFHSALGKNVCAQYQCVL